MTIGQAKELESGHTACLFTFWLVKWANMDIPQGNCESRCIFVQGLQKNQKIYKLSCGTSANLQKTVFSIWRRHASWWQDSESLYKK